MLGGTGGVEWGAPGPRPGPSTVLSVFLVLRHLGLGLALQSQSLAFSLDSHHGLSVRLAQSQQPWPTDHRGGGRVLQIEVLPGYSPEHNGIMYLSTNHKGALLCVLGLDHDL